MMKTLTSLVAVAALTATSAPALAQTVAAPASGPQGQPATATPLLGEAQAAPDCGNLYGLAGKAFCISAPLTGVGALADTYIADFQAKGWLVAGGDQNRVVFIKRHEGGGCDGLQMQAFYDTAVPTTPTSLGYLGFATIPGDVCRAQTPAGPAAATPAPAQ